MNILIFCYNKIASMVSIVFFISRSCVVAVFEN